MLVLMTPRLRSSMSLKLASSMSRYERSLYGRPLRACASSSARSAPDKLDHLTETGDSGVGAREHPVSGAHSFPAGVLLDVLEEDLLLIRFIRRAGAGRVRSAYGKARSGQSFASIMGVCRFHTQQPLSSWRLTAAQNICAPVYSIWKRRPFNRSRSWSWTRHPTTELAA